MTSSNVDPCTRLHCQQCTPGLALQHTAAQARYCTQAASWLGAVAVLLASPADIMMCTHYGECSSSHVARLLAQQRYNGHLMGIKVQAWTALQRLQTENTAEGQAGLLHHQECLALISQPMQVMGLRDTRHPSLMHGMHQV